MSIHYLDDEVMMPMRRGIGITVFATTAFVGLGRAAPGGAQTVSTPSGGKEVPSAHGRSWIAFPDPLLTVRMDANGNITATAAPIAVAHEESGPMCAGVIMVSATPSNKQPPSAVVFPPPGRCSVDASAATLRLPVDSAAKFAQICQSPAKETPPPMVCTVEQGMVKCTPVIGPAPALPQVGDAWRRAEGWTGRVPYNGVVQVATAYARVAPELVGNLINPGVQVTCDRVPCVTFAKTLPDAATGKPYRAQLFSGAHSPVTITRDSFPAGLHAGADGYLTGTPTTPGYYDVSVGFDESYACPWNFQTMLSKGGPSHWSRAYKLSVRDGTPPAFASFATSADSVPSAGGNVTVTVQVTDNVGVAKILSSRLKSDGTGNTSTMNLSSGSAANGTWTITWPMAANTNPTPVSYTIKVWAVDAANNVTNATPRTVVVSGASSDPMPVRIPVPTRP